MNELLHCLTHNICNSTPGPDDVHPFMIKNHPDNGFEYVLQAYNLIRTTDTFPKTWRHSTTIPIFKPDKKPELPNSYRRISLTSVLCKILEKMVSKRLNWFLESNHAISDCQSGFHRRRSTIDQLVSLSQDIQTAFTNCENLYSIFFVLEKAYYKAWRYKILQKLSNLRIKGHLAYLIKNFLTDRTFQVRLNNCYSDERTIENGVPEGSVLSTSLFDFL